MEVTICKDQTKAIHPSGQIYPVAGIQISTEKRGEIFYDTDSSFFKAAVASGTKHQAFMGENNKLIIQ